MNKKALITLFSLLFSFILIAQKNGRLEILDTKVFDTKLIHLKGNLIDVRTPEEFAKVVANEIDLNKRLAKSIDFSEK